MGCKLMNRMQKGLVDGFGRMARKLRISVTDRCNMHCIYCMPKDVEWFPSNEILTNEELVRLTAILVTLGIEKVRVTGGEPLVRAQIEKLINQLSKMKGIKTVSMTTNGLLLRNKVEELKEAGLQSINISLDTFRADRFKAITGVDGLNTVLDAVQAAEDVGLKVKINTVVMRGWNDDEVVNFAEFARETGYTVRFIEFMPLDGSGIWTPDLVVSKRVMMEEIGRNVNPLVPLKNDRSEPATLYSFADGRGMVGFIPSMTEPFCNHCDRIRITSDGHFLTCLFEKPGYDLKSLLRSGRTDKEIREYFLECMKKKPEGVISIMRTKAIKPTMNLMHTIGG